MFLEREKEVNGVATYIRYFDTLDDLMEESDLGLVEIQTALATLCASGLVYASGPGRYSAGA